MSELLKLCGTAFISMAAVRILREANSSFAEMAASFFGVCVILRVLMNAGEITDYVRRLAEGTEAEEHLKVLLKAAGIAYVCEFTAGICRDCGAGSVASYVELFGKTELIMLSLPLMTELLELSFSLLKL